MQQVSLSELKTSWSHILPAPPPTTNVMGQRGSNTCMWECEKIKYRMVIGRVVVFYSGNGLTDNGWGDFGTPHKGGDLGIELSSNDP